MILKEQKIKSTREVTQQGKTYICEYDIKMYENILQP